MVWSNGPLWMAMYAQAYRIDLRAYGGLLIENTGDRLRLWGVLDHWLREESQARLVYDGVV